MVFYELSQSFIKENIKKMLFYIVLVVIVFPSETIILPKLYGKLFDANITKQYIYNTNIPFKTKYVIYFIFFLWSIIIIGHALKTSQEAYLYPDFLAHIRSEIFNNTIKKYENEYKNLKVGAHTARIMEVSRNIGDIGYHVLESIVPIVIVCIFTNIYFFYNNTNLGLISLVGLIVLSLVTYYYIPKLIDLSAKREHVYLQMNEKIQDSYNNLMNIYLNNDQQNTVKSNSDLQKSYTDFYFKQIMVSKNTVLVFSFFSLIIFVSIVYYLYKLQKYGTIKKPMFISLVLITVYYMGYLLKFSNMITTITTKIGNVENSRKFLEELYQGKGEEITSNQILNGNIKLKNINYKYTGKEDYVLKNINLEIKSKEKIAIIGKSGSGKSTLMKLIMRLYNTYEGEITIDDVNINNFSNSYLRRKVNYINQHTLLFNDSIINNIKKGNEVTDQEIKELIKKYSLDTVYGSLKHGILSNAGVNGNNLSLGMQKTTILLRGIFKNGKVIIFDEPLAGLDKITRKKAMKMIKERCNDKTVIIISHNDEVIPYVDRVININEINGI